ncbi:MAG: VWA domain-containing protein, partial [Candidatus Acidiferrales bacterium]
MPGGTVAGWIVLCGCAIALCAPPSGAQTAGSPAPAGPTSAAQSSSAQSAAPQSSSSAAASAPASSAQAGTPQSGAAQGSASGSNAATNASAPELSTHTTQVPLESHVNLVPIRVVVHDASGHAVENLHKEDFQVKQDGKIQFITHFSVETPASAASQVARGEAIPLPTDDASTTDATAKTAKTAGGAEGAGKMALPTRFVALLFDDSHLAVGDLQRSKIAALKYIDTSVKPSERVAIFNISGRSQVDFTDDHEKIREAIKAMLPTPVGAYDPATQHDCLQITYYQADLIQNKNDPQATSAANADALACAILQNPGAPAQQQAQMAAMLVNSTVPLVLQAGEINTQYAVRRLDEAVRRVAAG